MKKHFLNFGLVVLSSIFYVSCSNSGDRTIFNPDKGKDSALVNDVEQAKLLAEKKTKFDAAQGLNIVDQIGQFDGKVKLTIMIPSDQGLSQPEMEQLEIKLIQMVTANGIGGLGGNPRFIIAPVVNILKKDVTSNAPIKYSIKYDVLFYIVDIITGNVYGSYNMQFIGVESSEARAFIAGFEELNSMEVGFQEFLKKSQDKIIKYYNENGDKIITEANTLSSQKMYAQSIALLESIPMEAALPFSKAAKITPPIFQKYLDNECETILTMMKAAMGTYNDLSAAGYSADAMDYYKLIPPGSKCKKEADNVYANYKKNLKPQANKDWEKAERDWQLKNSQEELQAKVAIEGQTELLEKYKKDAAFNKLPWLRKLVHLGDYDPFDGYKSKSRPN